MTPPPVNPQDAASSQISTPISGPTVVVDATRAEPAKTDWRFVHLWQIQPVRDVLVIALVIGVIYVGARLSIVTVPMLLAVLLAYLFEPLVSWSEVKLKLSRPIAAISLILAGLLIIIVPLTVGAAVGISQGADYVRSLTNNVDLVMRSVDDPENGSLRNALPGESWKAIRDYLVKGERRAKFHNALNDVKSAARDALRGDKAKPETKPDAKPDTRPDAKPDSVPEAKPENKPDASHPQSPDSAANSPTLPTTTTPTIADEPPSPIYDAVLWSVSWLRKNADTLGKQALASGWDAIGGAIRTITSVGMFIFQGFLTLFFFYFFCSSWGRVRTSARGLIPKDSRNKTVELVQKMDRAIAAFIRGRLTICAVLMVFYTIGYYFIGVPAPMILGPLIAIFALFPYISSIGVPIAIFLLWLEPNVGVRDEWWWTLFMPLALFMCAQMLDDYVLTPAIQGKSTDMSTPVILFASIAGGTLAGFYGLLIAIPVAACLKIVFTDVVLPRIRAWSEGHAADVLPIAHK